MSLYHRGDDAVNRSTRSVGFRFDYFEFCRPGTPIASDEIENPSITPGSKHAAAVGGDHAQREDGTQAAGPADDAHAPTEADAVFDLPHRRTGASSPTADGIPAGDDRRAATRLDGRSHAVPRPALTGADFLIDGFPAHFSA